MPSGASPIRFRNRGRVILSSIQFIKPDPLRILGHVDKLVSLPTEGAAQEFEKTLEPPHLNQRDRMKKNIFGFDDTDEHGDNLLCASDPASIVPDSIFEHLLVFIS